MCLSHRCRSVIASPRDDRSDTGRRERIAQESPGHARWSFSYCPALRVQAACNLASACSASRDVAGRRLEAGARRSTARPGALGLEELHELALGLSIALDVALRHGQAGMAGEFLHVPETPPDLRDSARGAGDEGAAPGMRRTPIHFKRRIEPMKP